MLIYVVDDSPTQLQALVLALEEAGHQAHGFASLAAIQVALDQVTPDLVVADHHLRHASSWGTSAPLLEHDLVRSHGVPVIVVSADFDQGLVEAMRRAGAVAVLSKTDLEELTRYVADLART